MKKTCLIVLLGAGLLGTKGYALDACPQEITKDQLKQLKENRMIKLEGREVLSLQGKALSMNIHPLTENARFHKAFGSWGEGNDRLDGCQYKHRGLRGIETTFVLVPQVQPKG